jgi:hypothetical protein
MCLQPISMHAVNFHTLGLSSCLDVYHEHAQTLFHLGTYDNHETVSQHSQKCTVFIFHLKSSKKFSLSPQIKIVHDIMPILAISFILYSLNINLIVIFMLCIYFLLPSPHYTVLYYMYHIVSNWIGFVYLSLETSTVPKFKLGSQ